MNAFVPKANPKPARQSKWTLGQQLAEPNADPPLCVTSPTGLSTTHNQVEQCGNLP